MFLVCLFSLMFIYEVDDDYNDADGDVNAMAMIMQLFTY